MQERWAPGWAPGHSWGGGGWPVLRRRRPLAAGTLALATSVPQRRGAGRSCASETSVGLGSQEAPRRLPGPSSESCFPDVGGSRQPGQVCSHPRPPPSRRREGWQVGRSRQRLLSQFARNVLAAPSLTLLPGAAGAVPMPGTHLQPGLAGTSSPHQPTPTSPPAWPHDLGRALGPLSPHPTLPGYFLGRRGAHTCEQAPPV